LKGLDGARFLVQTMSAPSSDGWIQRCAQAEKQELAAGADVNDGRVGAVN
jgi:hypothetical protein